MTTDTLLCLILFDSICLHAIKDEPCIEYRNGNKEEYMTIWKIMVKLKPSPW